MKMVKVKAKVSKKTDKAYLIKGVWFPKNHVNLLSGGEVEIASWLIEKRKQESNNFQQGFKENKLIKEVK
jgi:hypothetical protein